MEIHLHADLNVFIKVEVVGEAGGEQYVGDAAEAEAEADAEAEAASEANTEL